MSEQYYRERAREESLRAAKGCLVGLMIGVPMWAVALFLVIR